MKNLSCILCLIKMTKKIALFYYNCRMAVKLICLTLMLVLLCPIWAREPCRRSATTCNECIQSGPECAWCTAPQFNIRCHTLKGLLRAGCHKGDMYNPRGDVQVAKNDSRLVSWFEDQL